MFILRLVCGSLNYFYANKGHFNKKPKSKPRNEELQYKELKGRSKELITKNYYHLPKIIIKML